MSLAPRPLPTRLLNTRMVEKVWGRDVLPAPFATPAGRRIGEIWFEPPPEMPGLLAKYLFPSEKLSVQVHPSDAAALPGEDGKEECWLVLDAEPGARLAIGFEREVPIETVRAAALDGSIEGLLKWHEASAGDVFFLPAGTVHAIGPGLSLLEIQQASDSTFRLYDYGRPRELHLERALAVLDPAPYPLCHRSSVAERGRTLIDAAHFRMDRIEGRPGRLLANRYAQPLLALPLSGSISANGIKAGPGQCLYADEIAAIDFANAGVTILTRPNQG
ncbi:class I mannose-6-phosphate isomerase [Erythrobacter aurantius]|uniref:class I mannose-6-phosphate isomerase n=1 Tax=Erythrobacter aurantius TaxID=2909249 RepID=UPI00207AF88E|nr:class I mannose-6-phosphate isomerase [Erythrobacter aurantius]